MLIHLWYSYIIYILFQKSDYHIVFYYVNFLLYYIQIAIDSNIKYYNYLIYIFFNRRSGRDRMGERHGQRAFWVQWQWRCTLYLPHHIIRNGLLDVSIQYVFIPIIIVMSLRWWIGCGITFVRQRFHYEVTLKTFVIRTIDIMCKYC